MRRRTDAALARAKAAAADAAAGRDHDELIRSRADTVSGAERGACSSCSRCTGYEIWYNSACATDAEVMLFCSKCGCSASDHAICARWQAAHDAAQRRADAAEAAAQARRQAREQAYARAAAAASAPGVAAQRRKQLTALGAPSDAGRAAAGAAYRRCCLRWHPDKQQGRTQEEQQEAQRRFCQAAEAWRALADLADDTWR